MNILYINHYAGGPTYGMEYRPYYLAREWVRAGHTVTIVAASHSHVRARQPAMTGDFTEEIIAGIRFVWCATPSYSDNGAGRVVNMFAFLRRLAQWRRWLRDKPDAVIASSTYPLDIYPARHIARHHGARLVWEVHDLWPLSPIELGGISPWHPFMMLLQHAENAACRSADVIVSMLPKADTHLRAHGMDPEKFFYVPNGIDPLEWGDESGAALPPAHATAVAQAIDKGHLLVAYAGAHGLANALDAMLDAAALTRDEPISWLLVGGGPEKAALMRQAAAKELANVSLLDPVPRTTIPVLLRAMDVLYIGLKRQPLFRFGISPNKLIDYMMAARPVICAIDAGNDLVGESGCGVMIEPENPKVLTAAVRRMAELGPAERERMGRRGHAYVEQLHLYPVLARRFLDRLTPRSADRQRPVPRMGAQ